MTANGGARSVQIWTDRGSTAFLLANHSAKGFTPATREGATRSVQICTDRQNAAFLLVNHPKELLAIVVRRAVDPNW